MANVNDFLASLPSGIKRDVEVSYQAYGDLQPSMAIRHWIEIPGTHGGSTSQWTCDGYASSRQYAGVIAEVLHSSFGYTYEVWSLRPFGNSPGPHILDFVPALHTDTVLYEGERKDVTEQNIRDFAVKWCINHYGIHKSNYQYVKALQVTFPEHNRVYTCLVQFSQSSEPVELQMQNLPGGLSVFSVCYPQAAAESEDEQP